MSRPIPQGPVPHGTVGGYTNHRCRCDECRAANTAYLRAWRHSKPKPPRELAPCGTASAARRHYRRGEPIDEACLEAKRAYERDSQARYQTRRRAS